MIRTLELLSPARDAAVGRVAILAGADAVYIGAPAFGARAAATNSIEDIAALCSFAHRYRARVYVTMNTIVYDDELDAARTMVWQLYAAGVDALIVQDMAYLEMELPPIALHASTQCDIRTVDKARRLADAGFAQLVLPREFTVDEIRAVADAVDVPVEVFVHGALCVSYSGDCQAGFVATGRSANRGACPQMCRLPYRLVDKDGRELAPERHYLSLRDLDRSADLEVLIEAGTRSFKIEGRLKDARYVANVTRAYSERLDRICRESGGHYSRSSYGKSECGFTPDVSRTFNRGYTDYFLLKPREKSREPGEMASLDTPKWAGRKVGVVSAPYNPRTRAFKARLDMPLSNGDGLGFFDSKGQYQGFRLNRVDGTTLYPATAVDGLRPGMAIYRNADKAFFDILDRPDASCSRTIGVRFLLDAVDDERISIEAADERGCRVTLIVDSAAQEARTPQADARFRVLEKTGDTIYRVDGVVDDLGSRFVAASVLAAGRRDVLRLLGQAAEATYSYDRRRPVRLAADAFAGVEFSYHDNIANGLARRFYRAHGAGDMPPAIEVGGTQDACGTVQVMQTRYCLRRELGACLRTLEGHRLPSPLFLRNDSGLYRLDFDCRRCGMNVMKVQ